MTVADTINLCRLAEWLEKLALHGTEAAGWPTPSMALAHASSIRAALDEIDRLKAERDAIIRAYIAHKPAFFIRDHTISETWQVVVPVRPELDRLGVDFQYHATETAAINAIRRAAGLKEPPNEYALSGVRPGRDHCLSRRLP